MEEIDDLLKEFGNQFNSNDKNIKKNLKEINTYSERISLMNKKYFEFIEKFIRKIKNKIIDKNLNNLDLYKKDIILLNNFQKYINEIIKYQNQIISLFNKSITEFSSLEDKIKTSYYSSNNFIQLPKSINTQRKITCILLLSNLDIITGFKDSKIIIYDKDNLKEKLKIEEFIFQINDIIQIKNGNLIISSEKTAKIFKIYENNLKYETLYTLELDNYSINKIIELKNENLVSCSIDCSIIIWKKINNSYIKQISIYEEENGPIYSIIEFNNTLISTHNENDWIIIWDNESYKNIKKINNIELNLFNNNIIITYEKYLIISGKGIYILNKENYEIIKHYYINNYEYSCIFKINEKSFLTALTNKNSYYFSSIEQWNFNKEKNEWIIKRKIENVHKDYITGLIYIRNQKILISSSFDGKINFYQ